MVAQGTDNSVRYAYSMLTYDSTLHASSSLSSLPMLIPYMLIPVASL